MAKEKEVAEKTTKSKEETATPKEPVTVPVTVTETGELLVQVDQIALEDDDKVRLVITEKKDGTIIIHSKVTEGVKLTPSALVGLIEVSKFDILNQQIQRREPMVPEMQVTSEQMVPTEVTLEEKDFESFPELKDLGKKAGDVIKLPKITVDALLESRGNKSPMKVVD